MVLAFLALGLLVLAGVAVLLAHRRLTAARERVDAAWGEVEAPLHRRHDLVPRLVSTVKGYAAHESTPLERLVAARTAARVARGPADRGAAETALSAALPPVLALAERNPQLRAADAFTRLREELAQAEEDIQAARRRYNGETQAYAALTRAFPFSLLAARGPFPPKAPFPLEPAGAAGRPVRP